MTSFVSILKMAILCSLETDNCHPFNSSALSLQVLYLALGVSPSSTFYHWDMILWSKFFWGLAVSLMWKQCKFLHPCWSSMTSLHMVGVKICLCFDSQAFPQKYKRHMFWQPCEAVGRGETCTSLWWESIDGEFATMKPSSFSQRIPNFATARNPSKSCFWREPPILASSRFFNFKEPWVPWILAFFPFLGTHRPTPEQLITLLKFQF